MTSSRPYMVILDTNTLWTKGPEMFSRNADALFSREFSVQVIIPKVVLQEVVFQKFKFGKEQLTKAVAAHRSLEKMCAWETEKPPTQSRLLFRICRRAIKWCRDRGAIIADAPISAIDWKRLIQDAVMKRPPFSPETDSESDHEKGFKDAVIFETVRKVFSSFQDRNEIIFVTGDELLRETASQQITGISCFPDVQAFLSLVKLRKDEESAKFAATILENAPRVFFTPGDPECLYIHEEITKQIREAFGLFLEKAVPSPARPLYKRLFSTPNWTNEA